MKDLIRIIGAWLAVLVVAACSTARVAPATNPGQPVAELAGAGALSGDGSLLVWDW